jgi:hypothetical protein
MSKGRATFFEAKVAQGMKYQPIAKKRHMEAARKQLRDALDIIGPGLQISDWVDREARTASFNT